MRAQCPPDTPWPSTGWSSPAWWLDAIEQETRITVHREEVTALDPGQLTIVATGPLTSAPLCAEIARLTGSGQLAFYDSISPIVEADSIDMERVYFAARYDKGTADYINCPMSKEEYERFYDALVSAEAVESREWEKLEYFEGCLPIEELARRGRETLRFGPMKPVGLRDPRTGKIPWAVVQLRCENLRADSYNLVGLQNHLKFGEQARVLRLIPGLENAKFLRYGQIHRNTYVNAPRCSPRRSPSATIPAFSSPGSFPGSRATPNPSPPACWPACMPPSWPTATRPSPCLVGTALGSLVHYITHAQAKDFQPANITFDLLLPLEESLRKQIRDKRERHRLQCERALALFDAWWQQTTALSPA